jgi:hypothetical protein
MAVSFIAVGNRRTWKKPTDLPQVTDKLYHIMLYPLSGIWTHVSGDRQIAQVVVQLPYDHDHASPLGVVLKDKSTMELNMH